MLFQFLREEKEWSQKLADTDSADNRPVADDRRYVRDVVRIPHPAKDANSRFPGLNGAGKDGPRPHFAQVFPDDVFLFEASQPQVCGIGVTDEAIRVDNEDPIGNGLNQARGPVRFIEDYLEERFFRLAHRYTSVP